MLVVLTSAFLDTFHVDESYFDENVDRGLSDDDDCEKCESLTNWRKSDLEVNSVGNALTSPYNPSLFGWDGKTDGDQDGGYCYAL